MDCRLITDVIKANKAHIVPRRSNQYAALEVWPRYFESLKVRSKGIRGVAERREKLASMSDVTTS